MGNLRFEDLNISEQIRKGIREMGFEEATPSRARVSRYCWRGRM